MVQNEAHSQCSFTTTPHVCIYKDRYILQWEEVTYMGAVLQRWQASNCSQQERQNSLQALEARWDTTSLLWAHVWHLITALGTEEHRLLTAPRLKAIPFWACFVLSGDHPERCNKHRTPSNRDHRNKYLKDHLVLELTLIDSEKGNCTIQGWIWTRNKIFLHVYCTI